MTAENVSGVIRRRVLPHEQDFTQIRNAPLRDSSLSWKARGILAYLLAMQEGWAISLEGLAERSADGIRAVRSGIAELEAAGYLVRDRTRRNGQFATEWTIRDQPQLERLDDPDRVPKQHAAPVDNSSPRAVLHGAKQHSKKTSLQEITTPEVTTEATCQNSTRSAGGLPPRSCPTDRHTGMPHHSFDDDASPYDDAYCLWCGTLVPALPTPDQLRRTRAEAAAAARARRSPVPAAEAVASSSSNDGRSS